MKKIFLLSLFFLSQILVFATIRRVGFNGFPIAGIDYATFTDVHSAAAPGDTIQVYGTVNLIATGFIVTKRLIIIGFGYNLDANPNLQALSIDEPSSLSNGALIFNVGSENSIIEGCTIGSIHIATNSITVRRCRTSVSFRNDLRSLSNIIISSCATNVSMFSPTATNICTNVQIRNCILYFIDFYQNGSNGAIINCVTFPSGSSSYQFNLNSASFLVKNCIIFSYNAKNVNTIWENNFFGSTQPTVLPTGSNNRWGQQWANIFNRLGESSDNPGLSGHPSFAENYYILKGGSQAINGGFDSNNNPTDCGIFGGDSAYQYRLGGVPAIPAVYKLTAPSSAATTNPYNISISVRSNN